MNNAEDIYFFSLEAAREAAQMGNIVKLPDKGEGRQLCYYNGDPLDDGPETLIGVPMEKIFDYFVETPYRHPTFINFAGTDFSAPEQEKILNQVEHTFELVNKERESRRLRYKQMIIHQAPDFKDPVKRAFLMTSRHTSVIQYTTKGIAKALEKLGYEIRLLIEEDDLQILHKDMRMKAVYEFNPHVTININHMYNDFLNENTWNIVWWQDPMPRLTSPDPIYVRERDVVFSYDESFENLWIKKQQTAIFRQEMCIDTEIFNPVGTDSRVSKVVFVGTSYYDFFTSNETIVAFKDKLVEYVEEGLLPSKEEVSDLANHFGINLGQYPIPSLMQGVIREACVHWLCKYAPIEVEIYGPGWEEDKAVSPYYKGPIAHGKALADLYRSSKYAMVCQGANIQSQRLAEVTACGAIPVVYDSRPNSPDPLWEKQYLFFRTAEELKNVLTLEPEMFEGAFERISSRFSYDCFARKIDRIVQ